MDRFRKNFSDYFSIVVIAAVILCFILMDDTGTTAALRWLAVVFSVSFFMRPFFPVRKLSFFDAGFGLSFGTGLFICFYLAWVISSVGVPFSDGIIFASLIVPAAFGWALKKFIQKETFITATDFKHFLNGFAIFALIFLAVFWVIGFNPLVDPGTENYMDFGFMQTIYRQKSAIPNDIWFAGEKLNYYYLGQAASVYMCRLAITTPEYGYNMMLATFAGMTFLMCTELICGIADALIKDHPKKERSVTTAGVLGGTLAAFGANPHWLLYGLFIPFVQKLIGTSPSGDYWFSDPTVYIRSELGDPDNGKNEFPAYSFILGDLHAHVINIIFVLPLIGMLFDLVLTDDEEENRPVRIYRLVLIATLLAYYKGANYWDFAIYYVITGAVIVFADLKRYGFNKETIIKLVIKALLITAVSIVAILPFTLNFVKMESGIRLCDTHTPLFKFLVLWGLPIAVTLWAIYTLYRKKYKDDTDPVTRVALLAFMLCTIGLTLVPEVVYVEDIYGSDNKRFNTMFKLTYQAYVLFAIIAGIAFALILKKVYTAAVDFWVVDITYICLFAVTVMSASYTASSIHKWFGNVFESEKRIGISSLEGLRKDEVYGFEMAAYDVLRSDDRKIINIIEASGDSYSHESALSVYSGACTPAGWFVHEWMWHNDPEPIKERADSVSYFFTSGDVEYCRDMIKKYDIDYIFVGPAEVCRYPVDRNGFENLGEVCVETVWQDVRLELIKVDRSRI